VELILAHGAVNLAAVTPGAIVWKTDDPAFRKRMERSYARDCPARRVPLTATVQGTSGGALRLTLRDPAGVEGQASWPGPLERARQHPTTPDLLRAQLGRLGDTPFALGELHADLAGPLLVPKSVLNDLRRQAVAALLAQRAARRQHAIAQPDVLERTRAAIAPPAASPAASRLIVLVRTPEQLDAVLAWRPAELPRPALVWCEFEDLRRYRDAVAQARAAGLRVGLAPPRIVKPGEEGFLRQVIGYEPDALLIRNLASLTLCAAEAPGIERVGDFALNVANEVTADLLLRHGLARLTPSYDLNWEQLAVMLGRIDPARFEVVVHQHMPMFHMEHCVFAAFLSTGRDWRDCGRPCDHHRVELRDRVGAEFPVLADAGCRNTVFNAVPQSAAEFLPRMQALGLRHFRVELLRERAADVAPLLENYARVLTGRDDGRRTWRHMRTLNQLGVTRGTLRVGLELVGK